MKLMISKTRIVIAISFVACVPPSFMLQGRVFTALTMMLLGLIVVFCVRKATILLRSGEWEIGNVPFSVLLYGVLMWMITYKAGDNTSSALYAAREMGCLIVPFFIIAYCSAKDREKTIDTLFKCATIYVVMDCVLILFLPNGLRQSVNGDPIFFTGGKFATLYMYLVFLLLFSIKRNLYGKYNEREVYVLITVGTIFRLLSHCSSGVLIMSVIFLIVLFRTVPTRMKHFRLVAIMITVAFLWLSYLVMFRELHTKIPFLSWIITDVLGKDLSLTGRFRVYNVMWELLSTKLWFGYGYGSTAVLYMTNGYIANTQNGFTQVFYYYGAVGFSAFIIMLVTILRKVFATIQQMEMKIVVVAVVTAYLIAAIIEIPFKNHFYLISAIMYYLIDNQSKYKPMDYGRDILG